MILSRVAHTHLSVQTNASTNAHMHAQKHAQTPALHVRLCVSSVTHARTLCNTPPSMRLLTLHVHTHVGAHTRGCAGHGGITDRMDCQIIMSVFVTVYRTTFEQLKQGPSVAKILSQVGTCAPCVTYARIFCTRTRMHTFLFLSMSVVYVQIHDL